MFAAPADRLVMIELGEDVGDGVRLGVLVDLSLPAVSDDPRSPCDP